MANSTITIARKIEELGAECKAANKAGDFDKADAIFAEMSSLCDQMIAGTKWWHNDDNMECAG